MASGWVDGAMAAAAAAAAAAATVAQNRSASCFLQRIAMQESVSVSKKLPVLEDAGPPDYHTTDRELERLTDLWQLVGMVDF